jgi:hypothetical protein
LPGRVLDLFPEFHGGWEIEVGEFGFWDASIAQFLFEGGEVSLVTPRLDLDLGLILGFESPDQFFGFGIEGGLLGANGTGSMDLHCGPGLATEGGRVGFHEGMIRVGSLAWACLWASSHPSDQLRQ